MPDGGTFTLAQLVAPNASTTADDQLPVGKLIDPPKTDDDQLPVGKLIEPPKSDDDLPVGKLIEPTTKPLADVIAPASVLPPPAPVMTAPSNMPTFDEPRPEVAPAPGPAPAPAPAPPQAAVAPPAPTGSLMDRVDPLALADAVAGQTPGMPGVGSLTFQPPDDRTGVLGGIALGAQRSMEEGRRLGRGGAFSEPPAEPLPDMTLGGRLAFGITHGLPTTLAAGLGGAGMGAAGGSLFGPPGAVIGGIGGAALAGGAMSAAQALVPAYDQAIRSGATHDAAVDYAIKTAEVSGMFGAITSPLFTLAPFRNAVSNALLHIGFTAPVTSVEQSVAQSVATDQPLPSSQQMAETAVESAASAGAVHGITQAGRAMFPPRQPGGPTLQPTGAPEEGPPGTGGQRALEGPPQQPEATEQLPAPTKLLPAPDEPVVREPEPSPDKTGATPDREQPIVPGQSPQPEPTDTGAGESSSLPVPGPGQTGGGQQQGDQGQLTGGGQGGQASGDTGQGQQGQQGQGTSVTPGDQGGGGRTTQPDTTKTPTEGAPGSTRVVETNVPSVSLPTAYRVVEANTLRQATGVLQPRDRQGRQGSDVQVAENAARLDPFRLTGFPTAEHGAPVVALDGTVLAGNGRLAAINRAAELHPERYAAYKQALTDLGHDLSGFDRPVLVRQSTKYLDQDEARRFAEASNVPAGMSMSPVEQAKVDARNLTDDTLAKYDPTKQLTSPANQGFMRDWMQSLPAVDRNRLLDAQGNLSSEGLRRVQGAVLAKAYEHDPLLTRALESPVDDVKSVTGSLMDAAAPYVKLKSQVNQGALPKDLDITHNIAQALDLMTQARAKGIAPGDMLKQGDIFSGAKLDPVTEQVLRTFYNDQMTRLRSRPKMTEALRDYVKQALAFRPGKDLFGEETKADPAEMLRQAREGPQGDLIAAESKVADTAALSARAIPAHTEADEEPPVDEGKIADVRQGELSARTKVAPVDEKSTGDEEEPDDTELGDIDKLSPDELFAGDDEETQSPRNTTIARLPEEQPQLDKLNKNIATQEANLARAYATNKGQRETTTLEANIAKLKRQRDALTSGAGPASAQARLRPGQFRPKPSREPPSPHRVKPRPNAPADMMDLFFRHSSNNVWQQAFTDAGQDPSLATSRPLTWQIETLRKQTQRQFGFRDVTVDPKMDKLQARDVLLDTYRAATDGMASLGYPTDALGVFKTVALHLKPFDPKGDHAGQYVFANKTIELVGTANSLGHEWTHAVDHWLLDQLYPGGQTQPWPLASSEAALMGGDPNDDMAQRFGRVLQALYYDEAELAAKIASLQAQSQRMGPSALTAKIELDRLTTGGEDLGIKGSRFRRLSNAFQQQVRPGEDYYGTIYELIARAHEAYISRRMEEAGVHPTGFVMQQAGYLTDNVAGLNYIYPKEPERTAIYQAFDHLHIGLRNMLMGGSAPGMFADKNQQIDLAAFERNPRMPPGATQALKRAWMESVAAVKDWRVSLAMTNLFDRDRPVSNYTVFQRMNRELNKLVSSPMGQLELMHAMIVPGGRAPLRQIMQMLGTSPTSSHAHPTPTFEERYIGLVREWTKQFTHILEANKLTTRDMTTMKERFGIPINEMIHHGMTTEGPNPDTYQGHALAPNVKKAVGELRALQDAIFRSLRKAGLDIQYSVNGHFPRVYDHQKIWSDTDGFIRDARKLFKLMFDREVGTPPDPAILLKRWRQLSMTERAMAPQDVQDAMVKLAKLLRKLATMPKRIADIQRQLQQIAQGQKNVTAKQVQALHRKLAKAHAQVAQWTQDVADLADQWADSVGDHIAQLGADEWAHRVNVGYQTDFDTIGPNGAFLNHRKLPPAADDIMKKWLITDVPTALVRYYQAAARKQAFHEIMGPNQDKFEALLDQMYEAGVRGEDLRLVRDLADKVTGRGNFRNARGAMQVINLVKSFAAARLLGASWLSMVGEPMVSAVATRNLQVGVRTFVNQIAALFNTADAQDRAEIADLIGVTTNAMYDDILLMRQGTDYRDSPRMQALMGAFYRGIGLTGWNNSTRRASLGANNWFLTKLSNDWLAYQGWKGTKRGKDWHKAQKRGLAAITWLNQLGIPEDKGTRFDFAQWMVSHDGLPDFDELQKSDWRPIYSLALRRLVDRSVQNPKRSELPDLGVGPVAALITQFQGFNFSMQRNVLDPALHQIEVRYRQEYEYRRAEGRGQVTSQMIAIAAGAGQAAHFAGTATALISAQIPASTLRLAVYHPDVFQRELKNGTLGEYIWDYALNQSGLNGSFSMPLQATSQIRYNGSLSTMFDGPGVNDASQNIGDIFQAIAGGGEQNTNTRIYKGVRAAYNLTVVPLAAYGLARVAGGFGPFPTFGAFLAYSGLSSRPVSDWVTTHITGPKGATRPQEGEDTLGGLEGLEGLEGLPSLEAGPPDPSGGVSHGFTSSIPWGILDDFAIPATRRIVPYISMLPPKVRWATAAGLAVWGGRWFWNEMEEFRNAPPPEPPKGPGYP